MKRPANENHDDDPWVLPEGYLLRLIEIEGRLVPYEDRDPALNKRVRDSVDASNRLLQKSQMPERLK